MDEIDLHVAVMSDDELAQWLHREIGLALAETLERADEMRSRCKPDGTVMFFVPIE